MSEAEATLRLIAKLPAPQGLAERIESRLKADPVLSSASAHVLKWPAARSTGTAQWMRAAAAAAIVAVVAGGAWQISMRVGPSAVPTTGNAVAAPTPVVARPAGGFSSAGAMRTPSTLNGPILKQSPKQKPDNKSVTAAKKKAQGTAPAPQSSTKPATPQK